jgi:hypothetical protein
MIFGKTDHERYEKYMKMCEWHKWFAWYPVPLTDGRKAWLQYVYRKRFSDYCQILYEKI